MSLYSFYNKRVFPKISNYRGADFIKRNLKELALRNTEKIPESEREGLKEKEWDNLIILDACRHDLFEEVVGKSDYRYSLGSSSSEFVEKNFSEGDWSDTVYVTSNPHFHESHFENLTGRKPEDLFHEVFHTYKTDWDESERTIMPEALARDAKTAAKLFPDKKLVIHFMQPHYPFLGSNMEESGIRMIDGKDGRTIWDKAENGEVEDTEVWEAYKQNLAIVMDYVKNLHDFLEGKNAITADHANLFGEGGLYGHPRGVDAEPLLKVPWYNLSES